MSTIVRECPTKVFVLAKPLGRRVEVRYYTSARQLATAVVDNQAMGLDGVTRELVFGRAYVLTDGSSDATDLTDLCSHAYYQHVAATAGMTRTDSAGRTAVLALQAAIVSHLG